MIHAVRRFLQHNNANTSHSLLIRQVLFVNSSRDRGGAIVVEIEVKLAIAGSKFELLEEQRVVVKCECIKHIKVSLSKIVSASASRTERNSSGLLIVTFLARIRASFISISRRSLRAFMLLVKAVSVA
jgi:predicted GIY-YIG superfamily endonuclease